MTEIVTPVGDMPGPHSPIDPDKARFLSAVLSSLEAQPLAVDTSGYGEEGWVESCGELDPTDLLEMALTAYYVHADVSRPAWSQIVQEARYLQADSAWRTAPTRAAELKQLRDRLADNGWDAQTAANAAEYRNAVSRFNRVSTGQCAITALVVQDRFGGHIMRVPILGGSHYYNVLPDCQVVDLTRDQFTSYDPSGPAEMRTREYLLSNDGTRARYELLTSRLG